MILKFLSKKKYIGNEGMPATKFTFELNNKMKVIKVEMTGRQNADYHNREEYSLESYCYTAAKYYIIDRLNSENSIEEEELITGVSLERLIQNHSIEEYSEEPIQIGLKLIEGSLCLAEGPLQICNAEGYIPLITSFRVIDTELNIQESSLYKIGVVALHGEMMQSLLKVKPFR